MVDCPLFNHCKEDCRQCTDEMKQQRIKEIAMDLATIVAETINATILEIFDCIVLLIDLATQIYKKYPNKRIVWLALYHPKTKVRKKNKSRIIKYYKKHNLDWRQIDEH